MLNIVSRRIASVFVFFSIFVFSFTSLPVEAKAESTLSKVYTTYIIEPGVFAIETLNEMFSTLTGGSVNLLANTAASTSSSNIIDDYIIEPLGSLLYSIFDFSVDVPESTPDPVSNVTYIPFTPSEPIPTPTVIPEPTPVTTISSVVNYYTNETSGSNGAQGPKGDTGPQGPRGERGPAGADAVVDTSNFVNASFFDNQVDGILGSIEDGISGLSSSLAQEFNTGLLDVSGSVTIGSALAGTDKALVVNNNTSTGNIFEAQDGGTAVFTIADGGNVGVGTGSPLTQFDVAPITPVLKGTLTLTPNANTGSSMTMSVFGDYAYWTTRGDELLHIVDITNPAAMVEVSTLAISSSRNNALLAYANNVLYIGKDTNAFDIVDVSNPKAPILVKTMATGCSGSSLISYVRGNVLFNVGQNNSGACINAFDISDPVNPVLLSRISSINGTSVAYDGGRYMVVSQNGSTTNLVIDVSNPANITQVSTFTSTWNSPDISMKGRYVYACRIGVTTPQMEVFDIKDPSAVTSVGTFNFTTGFSCKENSSTIAGNYLYVGNQGNSTNVPSIGVIDISDPASPVLKATYAPPVTFVSGNSSGMRVFVKGRTAFLGWTNLQQTQYKLFAVDLGGVLVNQLEASTAQLGKLDVSGLTQFNDSVNIRGGLNVGREMAISGSFSANALTITQALTATGALKGIVYTGAVNTNQTLSTEIPSLTLTTAGRQWATGALATQREVLITQPTYSFVGASTITDAATVGIAGAPIKSTNASITNTHGLLIQAGAVSTATNSYGLTVNAQTGATNNYAAQFIGGNVGIGTSGPGKALEINSATGNNLRLTYNDADGSAANYADLSTSSIGGLTITSAGTNPKTLVVNNNSAVSTGNIFEAQDDGTAVFTVADGGGIILPNTTFTAQRGVIYKNATPWMHDFNYGNNGTVTTTGYNIFIGGAGNFTMGSTATNVAYASENVAIGSGPLYFNTIGYRNSVLGNSALVFNSTGSYNLALGYNAANANTTGSSNIAVGVYSLALNEQGVNNVAVGDYAFRDFNPGSAVGYNTAIGSNTARGITTGVKNTVIGARVQGLAAGLSNNVIIADGDGNRRLVVDENGTVGIGSGLGTALAGSAKALVLNNGTSTGNIFEAQDNGTAVFTVADGGNAYLGATVPIRSTTAGTNQLILVDGTAPVGTLTNAVSLYSTAGELRVMDAAGNATLLSPHENEHNYWVFDSVNDETGKGLLIDMEEMMKRLNNTFGWDYVHETINGIDLDDEPILELPDTFFESITNRIVAWLADASNGITDMFAVTYHAKEEICINETCINEDELKALLQNAGANYTNGGGDSAPAPEPLVPSEPVEGEPTPEEGGEGEVVPEETPEPDTLVPSEPVEGEPTPEEPAPEPAPETI